MSLTGTWELSIATPMGINKVELKVVQDGDTVTGTSQAEGEAAIPLESPALKGNQLTWKSTITKPISVTAKMTLDVDGDTGTGTVKAGMFPAVKMTAKKIA